MKRSIELGFFIPKARLTYFELGQTFIKVPIFYYFDLKYYIQIKTDKLKYIISRVFNQLTLNNLG